jgi:cytochrome c-type biogenesis protein
VKVAEPTLVVAAFAGIASFLSPCMLPVIPAFLAQLASTSLDLSDLRRRDVLLGTGLFVAGFSAVFATLGVVLGTVLGRVATEALAWLSRLAGTVVIVLGLHLTGLLRLPVLVALTRRTRRRRSWGTSLPCSSARLTRSPGRRA